MKTSFLYYGKLNLVISFVIISGGDRTDSVYRLINSIKAQNLETYEILLIGRFHGDLPDGLLFHHHPAWAANASICHMRNFGVDHARGETIILLDDDAELLLEWAKMMAPDLNGRYDITGCKVLTPTGARWYDWAWASRVDDSCPTRLLEYNEKSKNAYISGCFMMIRSHVFKKVRFDETRLNHQKDDVDFCHRAADAGFSIGVNKEATVIHHLDPAGRSDSDPASGSEFFTIGVNLYRLEKFSEARSFFRLASEPEILVKAKYHEGLCSLALGDAEEAQRLFKMVLALTDNSNKASGERRIECGAHYRLGALLEKSGDMKNSFHHYKAATDIFPEHHEATEGMKRTSK